MKIIIADHQVLFREGLSSLLNSQPDIEVIDVIDSVNKVISATIDYKPDILIFDIAPHYFEGLDVIRTLQNQQPGTKVIVLTNEMTNTLLFNSLMSGAKGFLLKNNQFEYILSSIRAVERGEAALSRQMTRSLLDELSRQEVREDNFLSSMDKLTEREYEIFGLLTSGMTNRQIADELYISENTVKIHVHNVLKKLKLKNRREAVKFTN